MTTKGSHASARHNGHCCRPGGGDAIRPGEFIILRGEVTRPTRGLVFLPGVVAVHQPEKLRDAGAIDGIWRVLRPH
jgi:hypothetical protein